ncbi:MAG TPA: F0F1 ATP synthase subunit delta [Opitutaceae bacterium]|jgi:F-type H+-transporting ATPase subunit delta
MAGHAKVAHQLARQLFKLSLENGIVSPERVAGVLAYIEKHRPANPVMVLRAYQRFVGNEVAKSQAVVSHAGAIQPAMLDSIAAAMTKKYGRSVTAMSKPAPELLAGLRVRVGDDIYESSVAAQLDALAAAV